VSAGSFEDNPACSDLLADKWHEYLALIGVGHFGRDEEIEPVIFGQDDEGRAALHAILYALAAHAGRVVIEILNWAGKIPNQPFYGFVGNIRPGAGHVGGLWRLGRRQENRTAGEQGELQWPGASGAGASTVGSWVLLFTGYYLLRCCRGRKRLIIAQSKGARMQLCEEGLDVFAG